MSSYTTSFVSHHHPVSNNGVSFSSASRSKKSTTGATPYNSPSMSNSAKHTASTSQPLSLSTNTLRNANDQGEDSDYCHESTPGRAWKKTEHAVPRTRVVGFNISVSYSSESPGAGAEHVAPSRSRQNPNDSTPVPSRSARQNAVLKRADFFIGGPTHFTSGKSRISYEPSSPIIQSRVEETKRAFPQHSDLCRRTQAKAN